jgi:hypothetical protein
MSGEYMLRDQLWVTDDDLVHVFIPHRSKLCDGGWVYTFFLYFALKSSIAICHPKRQVVAVS